MFKLLLDAEIDSSISLDQVFRKELYCYLASSVFNHLLLNGRPPLYAIIFYLEVFYIHVFSVAYIVVHLAVWWPMFSPHERA